MPSRLSANFLNHEPISVSDVETRAWPPMPNRCRGRGMLAWQWFTTVALLLTVVVAGSGCTIIRAPEVEVVGARWDEATDEAAVVRFDLEMFNPNDEALELRMMHYRFDADGRRIYDGRRAAQVTLAGGSRRTLSIPAVIRYDRLEDADERSETAATELAYALNGRLVYLVPTPLAETLLEIGLRRPAARFSDTGHLAFDRPAE